MRRGRIALCAIAAAAVPVAAAAAPSATPNDPYFPVQWALHGSPASTGANQAWCASTGSGVLVADIDTGADFSHPDLRGALVVGAAFTSGTSSPGSPTPDATDQQSVSDDYGHGTMTSGIVVAATGNGTGIAGEAPGARELVMKVFANHGSNGYAAYTSDVDSAIVWAVQHGARVINLSLGPSVPVVSSALGDQTPQWVQWASQNGAAVALAAGNTYVPAADYLNMSKYALVVGALGPSGSVASYSQHGVGVNIYAPGGDGPGGDPHSDVVSTFPTYALPAANQPLSANVAPGYAAYDGTSFATPYTAGVLALLMSRGLSAAQARQRILDTARGAGGSAPSVDAVAAVGGCAGTAPGGAGGGGGGRPGGGGTAPAGGGGAPAGQSVQSSTSTTSTMTARLAPLGGTRPEGNGGDVGHLGGTAPGATAPTGHRGPVVVLLAALGLLVLGGGPLLMALRRHRRGPAGP